MTESEYKSLESKIQKPGIKIKVKSFRKKFNKNKCKVPFLDLRIKE